jgi:hypothetical protein
MLYPPDQPFKTSYIYKIPVVQEYLIEVYVDVNYEHQWYIDLCHSELPLTLLESTYSQFNVLSCLTYSDKISVE